MATHLLSIKHYVNIFWWFLTFRGYKAAMFYYYEKHMGMVDLFAFRRAKMSTRQDFKLVKNEIERLVKKDKSDKKTKNTQSI